MKTTLMLLGCLLSMSLCQAQTPTPKSYSEALALQQKYTALNREAWEAKNEKLAEQYIDSTRMAYEGALVEAYRFADFYNREISLQNLDKPVFLTASGSWCAPCMAEIPAYNKIVAEYSDRIHFVVLFHDRKEKLATFAAKYNKQAYLVPTVNRTEDGVSLNINGFKHTLGYPTNYLLTPGRQIVTVTQGGAVPGSNLSEEQAFIFNYEKLKQEVEQLLSSSNQ